VDRPDIRSAASAGGRAVLPVEEALDETADDGGHGEVVVVAPVPEPLVLRGGQPHGDQLAVLARHQAGGHVPAGEQVVADAGPEAALQAQDGVPGQMGGEARGTTAEQPGRDLLPVVGFEGLQQVDQLLRRLRLFLARHGMDLVMGRR